MMTPEERREFLKSFENFNKEFEETSRHIDQEIKEMDARFEARKREIESRHQELQKEIDEINARIEANKPQSNDAEFDEIFSKLDDLLEDNQEEQNRLMYNSIQYQQFQDMHQAVSDNLHFMNQSIQQHQEFTNSMMFM